MHRLKISTLVSLGLTLMSSPACANPSPIAELNKLEITSTDRNAQLEISGNKPLTYTFYKISPRVAIIDIAAATPTAGFTVPEKTPKMFSKISIEKREQQTLILTRLVFSFDKEYSITVQSSPENKGRLLATFSESTPPPELLSSEKTDVEPPSLSSPPPPASAIIETAVTLPLATENPDPIAEGTALAAKSIAHGETSVPDTNNMEVRSNQIEPVTNKNSKLEQNATEQPKKNVDSPPSISAQHPVLQPVIPVKAQLPKGSIITLQSDSINIAIGNRVHQHKVFKLEKPNRLVIDIIGFRCPEGVKSVTINRFGIQRARIGSYPNKTRIVFDVDGRSLSAYQIEKKEDSLVLRLNTSANTFK